MQRVGGTIGAVGRLLFANPLAGRMVLRGVSAGMFPHWIMPRCLPSPTRAGSFTRILVVADAR